MKFLMEDILIILGGQWLQYLVIPRKITSETCCQSVLSDVVETSATDFTF